LSEFGQSETQRYGEAFAASLHYSTLGQIRHYAYALRMHVVKVPLEDRSYPVLIGTDALARLGTLCSRHKLNRRCAIISDSNVARLYGKRTKQLLSSAGFDPIMVTVRAGEKSKSLDSVRGCYDELAAHRLERKSFIVALGGGVVGDLAGFVAATYLRGIPFVQVPTSLMAQVDSSVGGKVGVNLKAGKNLAGSFYQPRFVLCDLETLETLPEREFRSGLAEVIKYGIIYDAALFKRLERDLEKLIQRDPQTLSPVIARCCAIKAEIVGQDETEGGLRAILNFGHTIGHAIEAITGYGKFLHGEAISIGQVAAARLSERLRGLPKHDVGRIECLFARAGLPIHLRLNEAQRQRLLDAMMLDKKVSGGDIKFVLAGRIGQASHGHKVPTALLRRELAHLAERTSV